MYELTLLLEQLEYLGISEILIPFAVYFAIVFSALQTVKILKRKDGQPNSGANAIIAIAVALAIIIPHIIEPSESDIVTLTNNWLPFIGVLLLGIVIFLLVNASLGGGELRSPTAIALGLTLVTAFLAFSGITDEYTEFFPILIVLVILGAIFGFLYWFIMRS